MASTILFRSSLLHSVTLCFTHRFTNCLASSFSSAGITVVFTPIASCTAIATAPVGIAATTISTTAIIIPATIISTAIPIIAATAIISTAEK